MCWWICTATTAGLPWPACRIISHKLAAFLVFEGESRIWPLAQKFQQTMSGFCHTKNHSGNPRGQGVRLRNALPRQRRAGLADPTQQCSLRASTGWQFADQLVPQIRSCAQCVAEWQCHWYSEELSGELTTTWPTPCPRKHGKEVARGSRVWTTGTRCDHCAQRRVQCLWWVCARRRKVWVEQNWSYGFTLASSNPPIFKVILTCLYRGSAWGFVTSSEPLLPGIQHINPSSDMKYKPTKFTSKICYLVLIGVLIRTCSATLQDWSKDRSIGRWPFGKTCEADQAWGLQNRGGFKVGPVESSILFDDVLSIFISVLFCGSPWFKNISLPQ